jgi:hypothetical protein
LIQERTQARNIDSRFPSGGFDYCFSNRPFGVKRFQAINHYWGNSGLMSAPAHGSVDNDPTKALPRDKNAETTKLAFDYHC